MISDVPSNRIPVAFLIDDGATVIDFCGPWEVFQNAVASGVPGFMLYTVAPSAKSIETEGNLVAGRPLGLEIVPDYTFVNAPQPRVIVIGAQSHGDMPAKLDWVRRASVGADVVMSVCTGAFLLGNTGLLDGSSATTHHEFYEEFEERFPGVQVIRDRRFVDNGQVISAGGLTAGIDGALHVVAGYYGTHTARKVADYMEYEGTGWRTGKRAMNP